MRYFKKKDYVFLLFILFIFPVIVKMLIITIIGWIISSLQPNYLRVFLTNQPVGKIIFISFFVLFPFWVIPSLIKDVRNKSNEIKKFFQNLINRLINLLKSYIGLDDVIAIIIGIFGGLFYILRDSLLNDHDFFIFYERIHIELIGISITVLILGNANQYTRTKSTKERLILQMGSPDNGFANDAVGQLRRLNWLMDGTLKKANLHNANLEYVDLNHALLKEVNFKFANLQKSNLQYANLEDSDLRFANLGGTDLARAFLQGANLEHISFDENTRWCSIYNNKTRWPKEFNPSQHNCLHENNYKY